MSGFELPAITISVIADTANIGELAMYEKLFCLENDAAYAAALQRIYEVTACTTGTELAEFLGLRLSLLTDAKRRKRISPEILLTLLFKLSINPVWILTGEGAPFLQPSHEASSIPLLQPNENKE